MGVTGSGKSSFIKALTGRSDIIVGDGLKSTTGDVQSYHITIDSINFVLVDTPGFNDTYRDDVDIIKAIIAWLNSSYRQGTKLTGILYLHPIKDPRMEGSSLRNFRAFQQLCGENTFKNIVLCTTFWDQVSEFDGTRREKELCENPEFWGRMKSRGSKVTQIRNYAQSKDILLQMAGGSTVTLDIQKEMVEERRSLDNTSVGRAMEEMARLKSEHEAQIKKLKTEGEKREEENRRRVAELEAVRKEQQRLLKEQEAEQARQARVKAQLQEDKRQEEIRAAAEKRRFEEVQIENKRLAAEKERLLNQWAAREADEKRAIAENHKRMMCRTFRERFAGQTQALDRARNYRMPDGYSDQNCSPKMDENLTSISDGCLTPNVQVVIIGSSESELLDTASSDIGDTWLFCHILTAEGCVHYFVQGRNVQALSNVTSQPLIF
ncbi:hypothetical protein G7Y79_00004g015100 [Physcia stellaris]|nr:hypothetical protein G7Y79_00004g015100 [Physcia stellaris]